MDLATATRILGVDAETPWPEVRHAYRALLRVHHPDVSLDAEDATALAVIEAFRVLDAARRAGPPVIGAAGAGDPAVDPEAPTVTLEPGVVVHRLAGDTVAVAAPADETFRVLLDAAHDVGEVTYLDRSMPIVEVLCTFVGEPATSLVVTLQGRAAYTELFCTVESIEARPAPPTDAVVDLLEAALARRVVPS